MVARLVGRNHERQPVHPRLAQLAGDASLGWASVEEHRGARAVLDQRRVPLADVEE